MNKLRILAVASLASVLFSLAAQTDDTQAELRLNPEIEISGATSGDMSRYPFVRIMMNRIDMNGDDWTALGERFLSAKEGDSLFSVVYLGDSHIQADFGGAVLRSRLAEASRPAGRGITIPFKLASTNQPTDYSIGTDNRFEASRLLKRPWKTDMPFTGVGVQPAGSRHTFKIRSEMPFSRIRVFYTGSEPEIMSVREDMEDLPFDLVSTSPGTVTAVLDRSLSDISITLKSGAKTTYGAFELLSNISGSVVHSIGNNGATYGSYAGIENVGEGIAELNPDLIIIALGTNEAFGRATSEDIRGNIDNLVGRIRRSNPDAKLLLIGPAECYKKTYRYVRSKNRRRRRVSGTVVNAKIQTVRDVIRSYAEAEGIPYYDHYGIAGGQGAAAKMKAASVLGKDGVHYTAAGYRLWGSLLADAILSALAAEPVLPEKDAEQQIPSVL